MQTSISIGSAYYNGEDWDQLVDYTMAADRMGVTQAWSAEAWGMDAIVPLAYLAAKTERIKLGTGILQISARVPSMIAMTAQSLDTVSKGRFILGLGVSGPQVVEGLHGAAFAKPLSRLRECVEILRMALAGEKLAYEGEHYLLPRPGGEGKALRLSQPPRPDLPIYLATLGPKSLQMTGEMADGWLGTCFLPEHADVFFNDLRAGADKGGRTLADVDIFLSIDLDPAIHRPRMHDNCIIFCMSQLVGIQPIAVIILALGWNKSAIHAFALQTQHHDDINIFQTGVHVLEHLNAKLRNP